ncbi:type 1 glutamine amidotransferase [Liquorilactobacillus nagelii]|uniref:type 1 glutamine amidotransferase n=1 Tax=Liquorilactobacillus nagelii TaxID=82688 RepID=UPI0006EEF417|nr:type 1 glutamine amidotransferase [Liquorilactobacillus nagelii]KRL41656.1 hypothetical protein FD45_GL000498 [Liquorilactobacillus nagelii DSM 13675]QYH55144.1 type 1 glutamine amidotransferase [Liquorilactobacillus nagelii DSM 13675]
MRVNIIQHTPNERPGLILDWTQKHQHQVGIYHPYQFQGVLPAAAETDLLIILGGPMNPNDHFSWLKNERQLIQKLLYLRRPIFGVCLGAQQIVKTLGGTIKAAPVKEVGWAPVKLENQIIPNLPAKISVLHWHQDTFSIPTGAIQLFSSELVPHQGFLYRHNVLGLQFHLEVASLNVREMLINDGSYLNGSAFKTSCQKILSQPVPATNQRVLFQLLDFICANN